MLEGVVSSVTGHILLMQCGKKTQAWFYAPVSVDQGCIVFTLTVFLAPLAIGQRAYVMACCPSCIHPSVCALTFSLNIFFSETTDWILMKFHRNFPAMVLFRIC